MNTNSLTPKLDAIVAKVRAAGHKVEVQEQEMGAASLYEVSRTATMIGGEWDHYCLATSARLKGSETEHLEKNSKMPRRLGLRF